MRIFQILARRGIDFPAFSIAVLLGGTAVFFLNGGHGEVPSLGRETRSFSPDPERAQTAADLSGSPVVHARTSGTSPEKEPTRISESAPRPAAPAVSNGTSSRPAVSAGGRNPPVPAAAATPAARISTVPAPASSQPARAANIPVSAGPSASAAKPVSGRIVSGAPGVAGSASGTAANPVAQNATKALDPSAAGNSLTSGGQQVTVESIQQTPDGNNLDLAISPASTGPVNSSQGGRGFTHAQELFRMKWGWENYDLAQRAAREVSQSP